MVTVFTPPAIAGTEGNDDEDQTGDSEIGTGYGSLQYFLSGNTQQKSEKFLLSVLFLHVCSTHVSLKRKRTLHRVVSPARPSSAERGSGELLIAERLSARKLILRRISEIVCMYVSVTLRNPINSGSPILHFGGARHCGGVPGRHVTIGRSGHAHGAVGT